MPKHETVWFEAGWFPYSYAFCPSERAWNKTMSKIRKAPSPYPEDAGATSLLQFINSKKPVSIVTVAVHEPQVTIEVLAHEGMHVWRDIRRQMGERKPSSELEAYAIQNILHNLMDAYQKTRGPLFIRRRP